MDPDPLRLLETAHPLRSRSISQGTPKPRFTIRPNYRLKRPLKLVHKTVNNFIKFVDGPTQMSRPRLFPGGTIQTTPLASLPSLFSSILALPIGLDHQSTMRTRTIWDAQKPEQRPPEGCSDAHLRAITFHTPLSVLAQQQTLSARRHCPGQTPLEPCR
jgi:hypothetical protein